VPDIIKKRQYKDYDEYVAHQKVKTADPDRRERLLEESAFNKKVSYFKRKFENLPLQSIKHSKMVCLGSRMGEEVQALQELGADCYGVDLVPHPPYVREGDFHNLDFISDSEVDIFYTNSLDHSSDPEKLFSEVSRCLVHRGYFVLDYFPGHWEDHAASLIEEPSEFFLERAKQLVIVSARPVHTLSNKAWQLVLVKLEDPTEIARARQRARRFHLRFLNPVSPKPFRKITIKQ
jgi:SAM-dependent methyltransferase